MEYVFGTNSYSGVETLRTKGSEHTNFDGFVETVQEFDDSTITDTFHVVSKTKSDDDAEGNCYDWYEIDRHYRTIDKSGPVAERLGAIEAAIERGLTL